MKGLKIILPIIIVIMIAAAKVRGEDSACDFSKYRPLVLFHPLVDAAVKKVEPKYPAMGTRVRAQGEVKVKIMVDRKGNVVSACAIEGHPLLRPSATHAAAQWKFKPNFGLTARQKRKYIQSFILFTFHLD